MTNNPGTNQIRGREDYRKLEAGRMQKWAASDAQEFLDEEGAASDAEQGALDEFSDGIPKPEIRRREDHKNWRRGA